MGISCYRMLATFCRHRGHVSSASGDTYAVAIITVSLSTIYVVSSLENNFELVAPTALITGFYMQFSECNVELNYYFLLNICL